MPESPRSGTSIPIIHTALYTPPQPLAPPFRFQPSAFRPSSSIALRRSPNPGAFTAQLCDCMPVRVRECRTYNAVAAAREGTEAVKDEHNCDLLTFMVNQSIDASASLCTKQLRPGEKHPACRVSAAT